MGFLGVLSLTALFGWLSAWIFRKYARLYSLIDRIPGPSTRPLIGNLHQVRLNPDEFFEEAQGIAYMFRGLKVRMARVWLGPLPFVFLFGAEEVEPVLSSNKMLTKMFHYSFLSAWIGEGLLISKPDKWRPRRKLLTPTFHYDILKDFVPVYNRHGDTLINKMAKMAESGDFVDIFHTITLCTLDIICEAALGVNINAQKSAKTRNEGHRSTTNKGSADDPEKKKDMDYLDAVFRIKYIIHQRMIKPQFYPEFLFNWFGAGREQQKCVQILHNFTNKAILARKKAMDDAGGIDKLMAQKEADGGKGIRMAFLDLMLDMRERGELDLAGIQEEVDTFTFEGHDTTSTALNWFIHLMGINPEIQARVQREIDQILGADPRAELRYEDLAELRYVEACLKETLRLYPSVPLIARQVTEDTQIKNFVLPAGTGVIIAPSMIHRDPLYWDNPEVFDPERFLKGDYLKHPYCYIPFSAGSRNCIGQRFALMEEKCLITKIFRNFRITSKLRTDQMRVAAELIIRPMYGNWIKMERRAIGEYAF